MSTPGAPSVSRVFAATATPSSSTASLPPQLPRPSLAPLPTLYPPENFTLVSGHIYRSGFPRRKHHPFLQQIGLRSILTLVLEDYPDGNLAWMEKASVRLYQFGVAGNKEPFVDIPEDVIADALAVLLDRRNHPILIHCNKGKHRIGCLVGCLRKIQHWSLVSIFDEYKRFTGAKVREADLEFIETFDAAVTPGEGSRRPSWL
jgi:tyrosine-protein phosphatase SIW14